MIPMEILNKGRERGIIYDMFINIKNVSKGLEANYSILYEINSEKLHSEEFFTKKIIISKPTQVFPINGGEIIYKILMFSMKSNGTHMIILPRIAGNYSVEIYANTSIRPNYQKMTSLRLEITDSMLNASDKKERVFARNPCGSEIAYKKGGMVGYPC